MPKRNIVSSSNSRNSSKESNKKLNKQDQNPKHICPKCDAQKTVSSRPQSGDKLVMRFLPKSPYRCLRCYHRFWKAEAFFASSSRVWTWTILLVALALFLFLQIKSNPRSAPSAVSSIETTDRIQAANSIQTATDIVVQPTDVISESEPESRFIENSFRENELRDNELNALSDKPLTPEQLEHQIVIAKQQAELAKKSNEYRQKRLKKSLNSAESELQSLLKLDISYEIDQWKRAWEAGDSARYLSFYSDMFQPTGSLSVNAWREQRKRRVTRSKKVSLVMSDFEVDFEKNNTRSTVNFTQNYSSGNYSDTVRKQLVLLKESQRWKIIAENEINE